MSEENNNVDPLTGNMVRVKLRPGVNIANARRGYTSNTFSPSGPDGIANPTYVMLPAYEATILCRDGMAERA